MCARWSGAILFALALSSCAPSRSDAFVRAFAEGERAESSGRYAEASSRFEAAAAVAKAPRDQAHARYIAALMLARSGNARDAATRLDAIADANPPQEDSAAAAKYAAELRIKNGDDAGWTGLEKIVTTFPNSGVARPSLERILHKKDETSGARASIAYLQTLSAPLVKSELAESIAFETARREHDLGDLDRARKDYEDIVTRFPYPHGALWDNALFQLSEIDETQGHYEAAIQDLERMLAEREVAHMLGSYQRERYSPALFRIAVLYRDRLHDRGKARDAFHRLYTDMTTSELRDDALWQEAELWSEEGATATACHRLATLVDHFPDSRYVACASERCPRVTRPKNSKAPTTCRAYIERPRAP
jgi:outer membrane protein assembly factor BamD (BamD/ComL family)